MQTKLARGSRLITGRILVMLFLTLCPALVRAGAAPMEVWVDDDYALLPNGSPVAWPQVTSGTGPHTIGVDAFASVQAALDAMNPYGTVWVAPGVYAENIAVEKPCSLLGQGSRIKFFLRGGAIFVCTLYLQCVHEVGCKSIQR